VSLISAKGEFSLAVPAGKYTVNLVPPAFAHIASMQSHWRRSFCELHYSFSRTSVKLNVRALQADATVSGTALKNGRPCAGAMIVLVPEDSTQGAALFHRDQSDSDGTFTMAPILPGRYTLLAIENGWDLEWSKLSVLFPYLAAGVPLQVKPGAKRFHQSKSSMNAVQKQAIAYWSAAARRCFYGVKPKLTVSCVNFSYCTAW